MPASGTDRPPADAILALRRRFLARCEDRLARMQELVTQLSQSLEDREIETTDELIRLAHEITGGGGTFGCPQLSMIAAELESYLACCGQGRMRLDERTVNRHLAKLVASIRHYARNRD